MRHSYSTTNFYTLSDLPGMTEHSEIWRLCGLTLKRKIWANHLETICEEERLSGCGHARSAPKNILEHAGEWGDIDVGNVELLWWM